jgi:uncharacterized protein YjbI with pentapeptide repeats
MRWPAWLGVGERRWKKSPDEEVQPPKTLWDFLQLLIVPAILVVIALAFNASQASRERQREDRRVREDRRLALEARRDATLDAYLVEMNDLVLNRHLLTSARGSAVRTVARTATLTAVRRLDGRRKGEVIRFLTEAGLLYHSETYFDQPVDLTEADLRGAHLEHAYLSQTVLWADLRGARFDDATLGSTYFGSANLAGASFANATLLGTDFSGANLTGATFNHSIIEDNPDKQPTRFFDACLNNASFMHASIRSADFGNADSRYVDFSYVDFKYVDDRTWQELELADFAKVRVVGWTRRPKRWPQTGDVVHPPFAAPGDGCEGWAR